MDEDVHAPVLLQRSEWCGDAMHPRLPHVHAPGYVQHIIFCTKGAFKEADQLPDSPDRVAVADKLLDSSKRARFLVGPAAREVQGVLLHGIPDRYRLLAWCIMPNHVHALVQPNKDVLVARIVQGWKSFSTRQVNRVLEREGPLWQANYFDRYMRDDEQLAVTVRYIEDNPVAAGLVSSAAEWQWSSAAE